MANNPNWVSPKTNWASYDYFNITDANRIDDNTLILNNKLREIGINVDYINKNYNWEYSTIPYVEYINRLKLNVKNMVDNFYVFHSTPIIDMEQNEHFTFNEANALEINLLDMYKLHDSVSKNRIYCGTCILGNDNI